MRAGIFGVGHVHSESYVGNLRSSPGVEFVGASDTDPEMLGAWTTRHDAAGYASDTELIAAGVDFGILGSAESCCGESIRKTGNEEVFKSLARGNIKAFIDKGVKKVLVASPHCYHTFKNEYPEFMVQFEVVHISA